MSTQADSSKILSSKSGKLLKELFESGRPLFYILTAEEQRISNLLQTGAKAFFQEPLPYWSWTVTEGFKCDDGTEAGPETVTPKAALDFIAKYSGKAVFQLKDFHEAMRDSVVVRRLRDLYTLCMNQDRFVVITSPIRSIPDELNRNIVYFELNVPDFVEIRSLLEDEAKNLQAQGIPVDLSETTLTHMTRALQGLTLDEAGFAIRRAVAETQQLGVPSLPVLFDEKKLLVNRSGTIEYVADGAHIDKVGGLEVMKKWLIERRKLFQIRDTIGADMVPKGVLVMGISGCGKSLSVKAIASSFELPLYRIDMAEVFSGRYGTPEWAFVRACKMMEEIAPAIIWFDEIEKGIPSESKGEQGRIFSFFLTWMQEKTKGLFVAATANFIDLLPAEMIRKGRFDEVFFVDLPNDKERVEIISIHLERRGVDPSGLGIERLTRLTHSWTGAECEQLVVSALTRAKLEERPVTIDDLLRTAGRIVPLSKTMKEQVDHIRSWARDRAAPASINDV